MDQYENDEKLTKLPQLKTVSMTMSVARFVKNFKGPRRNSLQFLFISIVFVCGVCLLFYTSLLYFGLFTRMEQPKPTRLSNQIASSNPTTTLVAQRQSVTSLQPAVLRRTLVHAVSNSHGENPAKLNPTTRARNGYKPSNRSSSTPDIYGYWTVKRHYSTQKQQRANKLRKDAFLENDPEANRVGPLYSFYAGGFVDPGQQVIRKCRERRPVVHLMVFSAPDHVHQRNAVRRTWATSRLRHGNVTFGFLVGRPQHPGGEWNLVREQLKYGDLVRPDFVDEYRNLTLKTMSMLEWFNDYCNAQYLLKIDDDVALTIWKLEVVLRKYASVSLGIIGHVCRGRKPIRDVKNKYYLSLRQWPARKRFLPPFTAGPSYLITGKATKLLYQRALQTDFPIEFMPLEDVLLTGIIAPAVNVKLLSDKYWLSEEAETQKWVSQLSKQQLSHWSGKPSCTTGHHYVTYHRVSYRHMSMMFEALQSNCTK